MSNHTIESNTSLDSYNNQHSQSTNHYSQQSSNYEPTNFDNKIRGVTLLEMEKESISSASLDQTEPRLESTDFLDNRERQHLNIQVVANAHNQQIGKRKRNNSNTLETRFIPIHRENNDNINNNNNQNITESTSTLAIRQMSKVVTPYRENDTVENNTNFTVTIPQSLSQTSTGSTIETRSKKKARLARAESIVKTGNSNDRVSVP